MLETVAERPYLIDSREVGTGKPDLEVLGRIQTIGFVRSVSAGLGARRLALAVALCIMIS